MNIDFVRRRLEKTFNSETALKRAFGDRMARTIAMRMAVLRHARTLGKVPVTRPDRPLARPSGFSIKTGEMILAGLDIFL